MRRRRNFAVAAADAPVESTKVTSSPMSLSSRLHTGSWWLLRVNLQRENGREKIT